MKIIKTVCDPVNHTRFLKEDHISDGARRDNKVTEGDRVEYHWERQCSLMADNIYSFQNFSQWFMKLTASKWHTAYTVVYPGILFEGVQQIQLRTEGRENGDLGAVAS